MAEDLVGVGKTAVRLMDVGEAFFYRLLGPWMDEKAQGFAAAARAKKEGHQA